MKKYYFRKEERLSSVKLIDELYSQGSSFSFYPFRITYKIVENDGPPVKVIIAVPKRKFKLAVDRNRIKRQIREAYRHIKEDFLYPELHTRGIQLQLMILFTSNEIITTTSIRKKLNLGLERLVNKLS